MLFLYGIQTAQEEKADRDRTMDRLLIRMGSGDREALADLYEKARAGVYALALAMLKDAHEAQDVVQDTFVSAWEHAPGYRAQGSPMAWLLTIARNQARMRLRRSGRQVELDEEGWNAIPAVPPGAEPEERQLLQDGLARLGDVERQIVLLHAVTGLKHRETAALLELPLSTVLSKYHRALKKLHAWMEGGDGL